MRLSGQTDIQTDRQKERHTGTLITILGTPTRAARGEVEIHGYYFVY